jgi:hypothetical protein
MLKAGIKAVLQHGRWDIGANIDGDPILSFVRHHMNLVMVVVVEGQPPLKHLSFENTVSTERHICGLFMRSC